MAGYERRGTAVASLAGTYAAKADVPIIGAEGYRTLTIIVYHVISSLAAFQTECDYYQQWNYTTVTPDQVSAWIAGTGTLPDKPLLITFDDGYASQYQAAQELHTRGMTATWFVTTNWIDGTETQVAGGFLEATPLTWVQLVQMYAWGHRIQSHTQAHANQTTLTALQVAAEYTGSKARIESQVSGETVSHMAYPFGAWNDTVKTALGGAGCQTARVMSISPTGAYPGANAQGQLSFCTRLNDPLALPAAGTSAYSVFQQNMSRVVTRSEQMVPDYAWASGAAKGWTLSAGTSFDVDVPAGQPFTRSLKIVQQTTDAISKPSLVIPVGPWAVIDVEVWMKTSAMGAIPTHITVLTIKSDAVTTYDATDVATVTGDTAWTRYAATLVGDVNSLYRNVQIYVQPAGTPTGTVWVTGLSIKRAIMPTVSRGSF